MTGRPYDVCIVGAGITGLNALAVSASYLGEGDRVALVDRRAGVGGMWRETYPHVQLHQPHRNFTAGSIRWELDAPPSHLATRSQVVDHLEHCLDVARQQVRVDEQLGWECVRHHEDADSVEVTLRKCCDGRQQTIRTKRLIKALGHQVPKTVPLRFSSRSVRSVTPETLDLADPALVSGQRPVWLIGAGKTAMDTAHLLITESPRAAVHVAAGPGVFFARREDFFPVGLRRWWSGTRINALVRDVANRFDGHNEADVRRWLRDAHGISPVDGAGDFFNAYLSAAESAVIRAGLRSVEGDYLVDVVDEGADAVLLFRSGRRRRVPGGTWVVNCTGSLLRDRHPYEPFVSEGGRVASLQMRSSTTGIYSAFAGYYLPHLMFRGELGSAGLYALDVEELHHQHTSLAVYASMSLAMHNLGLLADLLPARVMLGCGLDFDRWYPFPRRLLGAAGFLLRQRRERAHHRAALDAVRSRYDLVGGPLPALQSSGYATGDRSLLRRLRRPADSAPA